MGVTNGITYSDGKVLKVRAYDHYRDLIINHFTTVVNSTL